MRGVRRTPLLRSALALSLVSVAPLSADQTQGPAFAPALERYLSAGAVRLSTADRRRLHQQQALARLLDAHATNEVAVFGAIWINAPIPTYVAAQKNIETFEKGGAMRRTRRLSVPPKLDDFAELALPTEELANLHECRVGGCDVKMPQPLIEAVGREVDWSGPDPHASANGVMRRFLFDYVTGYLDGGNRRLAVYRDHTQPTSVADQFEALVEGMTILSAMPDVRGYLLNFPQASIADATSILYWQETMFGLKPTHRVSHMVIRERPDEAVVASKMLYATHYFWTALELRLLVAEPARGPGFWFITMTRSRMDGMTGFTGFFVRHRVRSEVVAGTERMLINTRRAIERRTQ